jgi:hypothetical protein
MERVDHMQTVVAALVHLGDAGADGAGLSGKVDRLVDGYLVSFNVSARQTTAMRKSLADEFLASAPFNELSYRIWRRIMREDAETPEPVLRVASDQLLPDLEFSSHAPRPLRAPQQLPAQKPADLARKTPRSFFGLRRS